MQVCWRTAFRECIRLERHLQYLQRVFGSESFRAACRSGKYSEWALNRQPGDVIAVLVAVGEFALRTEEAISASAVLQAFGDSVGVPVSGATGGTEPEWNDGTFAMFHEHLTEAALTAVVRTTGAHARPPTQRTGQIYDPPSSGRLSVRSPSPTPAVQHDMWQRWDVLRFASWTMHLVRTPRDLYGVVWLVGSTASAYYGTACDALRTLGRGRPASFQIAGIELPIPEAVPDRDGSEVAAAAAAATSAAAAATSLAVTACTSLESLPPISLAIPTLTPSASDGLSSLGTGTNAVAAALAPGQPAQPPAAPSAPAVVSTAACAVAGAGTGSALASPPSTVVVLPDAFTAAPPRAPAHPASQPPAPRHKRTYDAAVGPSLRFSQFLLPDGSGRADAESQQKRAVLQLDRVAEASDSSGSS